MAADSDVLIWATAISTHSGNGRKLFWRYAKDLDPAFQRESKPDRIILVWKYHTETGQPTSDEYRQMNLMEDALEAALKPGRFATLALVSTGEDLREWTYYTRSEDEFMDRLNLAFDGMTAFPIEIHTARDPEWSMYETFLGGVTETVR